MKLSLSWKLPLIFIAVTATATATLGFLATNRISNTLRGQALEQLAISQGAIADSISAEFSKYSGIIDILSHDRTVRDAVRLFTSNVVIAERTDKLGEIRDNYTTGNPNPAGQRHLLSDSEDGTQFSATHRDAHGWLASVTQTIGLSDLILINKNGLVMYTVNKRDDFMRNISDSDIANTEMARAAQKIMDAAAGVADATTIENLVVGSNSMSGYAPGGGETTAFLATPVLSNFDQFAGVLVFAIPQEPIVAALQMENGISVDANVVLLNPDGTVAVAAGADADPNGDRLKPAVTDPHMLQASAGNTGAVEYTTGGGTELLGGYSSVDVLGSTYGIATTVSTDAILADAYSARNNLILMVIVAILIASAISVMVGRTVARPVVWIAEQMNRMAGSRDLSARMSELQREDEIGKTASAFDGLIDTIDVTLGNVRKSSDDLNAVSGALEVSAQSLSANVEVESTAIEELSSSVEETSQQVRLNAESSKSADTLVKRTSSVVEVGKEKMIRMTAAMDAINASSSDIAKIIQVIDEIAFQTNLLALNAAVEAARAGQHGRGFAVVAQEVRNLAGRSAKAARETSELVVGSRQRVAEGVQISDETRAAFDEIASNIAGVAKLVSDISAASAEQSRGVDQFNESITEIARIVRETSNQADSLAATATQVAATNEMMRIEIGKFNLSSGRSQTADADASRPKFEPSRRLSVETGDNLLLPVRAKPAATVSPLKSTTTVLDSDTDERGFGVF